MLFDGLFRDFVPKVATANVHCMHCHGEGRIPNPNGGFRRCECKAPSKHHGKGYRHKKNKKR